MPFITSVTYDARGASRRQWFLNDQGAQAFAVKVTKKYKGSSPITKTYSYNPNNIVALLCGIEREIPLPDISDSKLKKQQKVTPIKSAHVVTVDSNKLQKLAEKYAQ